MDHPLTEERLRMYLIVRFEDVCVDVEMDIKKYFPFLEEELFFSEEKTRPYYTIPPNQTEDP